MPRKPEIEYISLSTCRKGEGRNAPVHLKKSFEFLQKLANNALKAGPFSIVTDKQFPHVAPSGDVHDFLSYAPYWWPENTGDKNTKYVRKDGKRNPGLLKNKTRVKKPTKHYKDIQIVKDQQQLELFAENFMYLCLGYFFFEMESYAVYAVELLQIFFLNETTRMNPNLNYAQLVRGSQNCTKMGRGEGVVSGRALCRIANMLSYLDNFYLYRPIDQHIKAWFNQYFQWLIGSPVAKQAARAKNNIHTWYIAHVVSTVRFLDPSSAELTRHIVDFFEKTLPEQIDMATGDQPLESKRAQPLHYLAFNMYAILYIAELAKSIELDMYLTKKEILHTAALYMIKVSKAKQKIDITEAARCVEIIWKRVCGDDCCKEFIDLCHNCEFAERISGPKNAVCKCWL
ncbi:hypothetical protein CU097_003519 [Rhizopus azygosporus]|uniref:Alginate lyase domain-containing protein n=2 Tax=Rhizopus TaxID=4842 RepID=A0A367IUQ3_RHIAZ|nr:hypothetical protein CU097_003519 [Rhizopus azygosporus]